MKNSIYNLLNTIILASLSMPVWSGVTGDPATPVTPEQTPTTEPAAPSPGNSDPVDNSSSNTPVAATPGEQAPVVSSGELINSTYSGLWFDPSRDGEGFALVISETEAGPTAVVSYYTYDNQKQSIFLVGSQSLSSGATSLSIPVIITSGAKFGDAFKSTDVVRTPAGTLSFRFTSCNAGVVDYNLTSLGSGSLSVIRLLGVEDLDCS